MPHEVHNLAEKEDVVAVVARADTDEWQNIVPCTPHPLRGEHGSA